MQLKTVYNFDLKAPALLGANRRMMRLISEMSYDIAIRLGGDENLAVRYAQVLPSLGANPPRAADTIFYLFVNENGKEEIIADSWIEKSTIVEVQQSSCTINIPNIAMDDVNKIRSAFSAIGLTGYTLEVK